MKLEAITEELDLAVDMDYYTDAGPGDDVAPELLDDRDDKNPNEEDLEKIIKIKGKYQDNIDDKDSLRRFGVRSEVAHGQQKTVHTMAMAINLNTGKKAGIKSIIDSEKTLCCGVAITDESRKYL